MSQMIDFTLPSCQPGRTLHAFRCVPEGEVRAVLQLSHGMVEFIDRYKPLAENLAARGGVGRAGSALRMVVYVSLFRCVLCGGRLFFCGRASCTALKYGERYRCRYQ